MNQKHLITTTARRVLVCSAMLPAFLAFCPPEVAAAVNGVNAVAQADVVKGKVVDQSGEPIIGATVKVEGQDKGALTDLDGNFSISGVKSGKLVITYIGYKTATVNVTAGTPVTVTIEEDTKTLGEVVVVGFGVQKKANLTGAVSVVDSEQFEGRPVRTATEALQGAVPGLQISSTGGSLENNMSINIRGTATIGQGSSGSPLILIDGSEGDLNTINPQDIETISVLKDAAASSIYGARAPFGVILITTKKGKEGKVSINYNNSFRFSNRIRDKHMMNSYDFASWMMDGTNGSAWSADVFNNIIKYHNAKPYGPGSRITEDGEILYSIGSANGSTWDEPYGNGINDEDIYDVIYKGTAFAQEHNASVSGGTDKVNFYLSLNYLDNNGFMKLNEDSYNRYAGTAKVSAEVTKWLDVNYSMRFTRTDYRRPAALANNFYLDLARQGWPTLPTVDRNGYWYSNPSPYLHLAEGGKDTTQRDILNHQLGFVIEPIKNWITHVDFNYRTDVSTRHWDSYADYNHDVNGNPVLLGDGTTNVHEDLKKENYLNFQAYTEYDLTLAEKHNFHIMAGFQAEQMKQLVFGLQRNGILMNDKPEIDLTTGLGGDGSAIVPSTNGARNQWQTAGFFGRLNYNFADRYLFEFNLRHDGTSRFRRNKMWKTFPSGSIGWNIANEKFFEPLQKQIGMLKLRASYGNLGNTNLDNWYPTYLTITYSPSAGQWLQNGALTNTVTTPGLISALLTWETIESWDIGLDVAAFNNRLTLSADYFIRNTKDMVGNAPELPAILGTGVPVTNNTDLRTSGWELQIAWRDRLRNGLSYGIGFNVSDSRTKITRYPNNPTGDLGTYIEGRYINEIWGYETVGLAKTDEQMAEHLATTDQSALGSQWAAGDIMYKDLNGDGRITSGSYTEADHGDLKLIGNSTPRYFFGINLDASWKGFDFRMFFQGVGKRDYMLNDNPFMFGFASNGQWWASGIEGVEDYFRNEDSWSVANGYQEANLNAYLPRVNGGAKNLQSQTRYLLNAAYMRCKNLQIGYTLPQKLTQSWGIQNLRVYFSVDNLFTITSLPKQFDPELLGYDSNNGYPLSRTTSFGLSITL